jgi:hypothetical protein
MKAANPSSESKIVKCALLLTLVCLSVVLLGVAIHHLLKEKLIEARSYYRSVVQVLPFPSPLTSNVHEPFTESFVKHMPYFFDANDAKRQNSVREFYNQAFLECEGELQQSELPGSKGKNAVITREPHPWMKGVETIRMVGNTPQIHEGVIHLHEALVGKLMERNRLQVQKIKREISSPELLEKNLKANEVKAEEIIFPEEFLGVRVEIPNRGTSDLKTVWQEFKNRKQQDDLISRVLEHQKAIDGGLGILAMLNNEPKFTIQTVVPTYDEIWPNTSIRENHLEWIYVGFCLGLSGVIHLLLIAFGCGFLDLVKILRRN